VKLRRESLPMWRSNRALFEAPLRRGWGRVVRRIEVEVS